eukprot:TRINITY_DN4124_c1_g1_i2.p2 TRINITY_DN4124_c1_g1~~TRINITY_DN4124_c1_g1_i2.p2  ORF type:complete len:145 (-),score=2.43 TRINITY_DN4124_c1_g1_i2:503-937(-)
MKLRSKNLLRKFFYNKYFKQSQKYPLDIFQEQQHRKKFLFIFRKALKQKQIKNKYHIQTFLKLLSFRFGAKKFYFFLDVFSFKQKRQQYGWLFLGRTTFGFCRIENSFIKRCYLPKKFVVHVHSATENIGKDQPMQHHFQKQND